MKNELLSRLKEMGLDIRFYGVFAILLFAAACGAEQGPTPTPTRCAINLPDVLAGIIVPSHAWFDKWPDAKKPIAEFPTEEGVVKWIYDGVYTNGNVHLTIVTPFETLGYNIEPGGSMIEHYEDHLGQPHAAAVFNCQGQLKLALVQIVSDQGPLGAGPQK